MNSLGANPKRGGIPPSDINVVAVKIARIGVFDHLMDREKKFVVLKVLKVRKAAVVIMQ